MAGTVIVDTINSSVAGTPPVFQANGTQIGTLCRAWVSFNGTGTVAIKSSFNVSSITDNGTGNYTVNFTTAMPDANYSFACCGRENTIGSGRSDMAVTAYATSSSTISTSSIQLGCFYASTGVSFDAETITLAVFR